MNEKKITHPTKIKDWMCRAPESFDDGIIPDWAKKEFDLIVDSEDDSLEVFLGDDDTGKGLALIIEVHQGMPCIHVSGGSCPDNEFHIYRTEKGLVLQTEYNQPKSPTNRDRTGPDGNVIRDAFAFFHVDD